jgi:hypothetical protein
VKANYCANGYLSPPTGYPVRLYLGGDTLVSGVIPAGFTTVTAIVATESGTADVHLALYEMPSATGGDDGESVGTTDATGVTSAQQTLTIDIPVTSGAPTPYAFKLWIDGLSATVIDTTNRNSVADVSQQPKLYPGVNLYSIVVS